MPQHWCCGIVVSKSRLASVLREPSKVTTAPTVTFWLLPALATGAELATEAVMVTAETVLSTRPSLTISVKTYVPATSAVKVGLAEVAEDKVAVLPVGLVPQDHL